MTSAIAIDDKLISVSTSEKSITVSYGEETLFTLQQGLREQHYTALLRVGNNVGFYRITQVADYTLNTETVLRMAMSHIPGGLFYFVGMCAIKPRKNRYKGSCKALMVGSTQVAIRDVRLLFTPVYVRGLGTVNLEDTGDITLVYQQLNALI